MNLYLVVMNSDDGESLDQFVSAESPEQAVQLWRRWWDDDNSVPRVFQVPALVEKPHVHTWSSEAKEVSWNLSQ